MYNIYIIIIHSFNGECASKCGFYSYQSIFFCLYSVPSNWEWILYSRNPFVIDPRKKPYGLWNIFRIFPHNSLPSNSIESKCTNKNRWIDKNVVETLIKLYFNAPNSIKTRIVSICTCKRSNLLINYSCGGKNDASQKNRFIFYRRCG